MRLGKIHRLKTGSCMVILEEYNRGSYHTKTAIISVRIRTRHPSAGKQESKVRTDRMKLAEHDQAVG
jgi:hypothetical protein